VRLDYVQFLSYFSELSIHGFIKKEIAKLGDLVSSLDTLT